MKIASFAPHLAHRMLPALFSECPELRKPRFPGDPWAAQLHWAAWYWMHAIDCPNGLFRAWGIPRALRDHLTPEGSDVRVHELPGHASPSVGSKGARQPADAGPRLRIFSGYRRPRDTAQGELFGKAS